MEKYKTRALISLIIALISGGTIFFHYAENWTWVDAYFFTVTTISTVGYGNLVPETTVGKLAATLLIFAGIGILGAALQIFGMGIVERRAKNIAQKRSKKNNPE